MAYSCIVTFVSGLCGLAFLSRTACQPADILIVIVTTFGLATIAFLCGNAAGYPFDHRDDVHY